MPFKFINCSFSIDFYVEHPDVAKRTQEEVDEFRLRKTITTIGNNINKPIETFEESCFPKYVLSQVLEAGFPAPTAIQSQGWPMALSGR